MKIREGLAANDYRNPGDYKHPQGTVAYEVANSSALAPQRSGPASQLKAGPKAVRPGNAHKGH
jgi:manganese oxidase